MFLTLPDLSKSCFSLSFNSAALEKVCKHFPISGEHQDGLSAKLFKQCCRDNTGLNKPAKQRHSKETQPQLLARVVLGAEGGDDSQKEKQQSKRYLRPSTKVLLVLLVHCPVSCQLRCAPTAQHHFPKTSSPPGFTSISDLRPLFKEVNKRSPDASYLFLSQFLLPRGYLY